MSSSAPSHPSPEHATGSAARVPSDGLPAQNQADDITSTGTARGQDALDMRLSRVSAEVRSGESRASRSLAPNALMVPPCERRGYLTVDPLDIGQMLGTVPQTLDEVFPGLLVGSVGLIVAPGGAGKSMLALDCCAGVATGGPIAGGALIPRGAPGRAVLFAGEDPLRILHQRIRAVARGRPAEAFGDRLCVLPLRGSFPVLVDQNYTVDGVALEWLCRQCEGARIVFVDTLRRLHLADENQSAGMTQVISALERVAERTGAAIVLLHHANRASSQNETGDQASASRGSTAITDNVRWVLNLRQMTAAQAQGMRPVVKIPEQFVEMKVSKSNYSAPAPAIWLRRGAGGVLTKAQFSTACDA